MNANRPACSGPLRTDPLHLRRNRVSFVNSEAPELRGTAGHDQPPDAWAPDAWGCVVLAVAKAVRKSAHAVQGSQPRM